MLKIRTTIFLSAAILFGFAVQAQTSLRSDWNEISKKEDSLKGFSRTIVNGRDAAERFRADSNFTRILVRALKENNSFYYPFDSLQTISRLYAPDSSFRIFTWQVVRDENMNRRHGAIQMRTSDGSLKLFALLDKTFQIQNINDTVTGPQAWVGAIYYRIVQKEFNGKKYYTLLGYDEHSIRSTKKRIEVLSFDANKQPVFGGIFSFEEDTVRNNSPRKKSQSRFEIEFKKDASARMQYDDDLGIIIYEHLIPENNEPEKKYTYIPDGDYEGFEWKNGKWVHIEKVFHFKLKDGEAPVANPVTEDKLNIKPTEPVPKKKKG
ncbi:MAG: hypothetical protein C5B52_02100 [Bacteroidetes bacterium]|nr:MAG: hypothetical protein C5B52_02100 [Bacteroidota bacterium]